MTKLEQAAKQALEALEAMQSYARAEGKGLRICDESIIFLREALEKPDYIESNGGRTGWPPGLLQDDCRKLGKWFAGKPDARQKVREALAEPTDKPVAELWDVCEGEPVILWEKDWRDVSVGTKFYTRPQPAAQWVEISKKEMLKIVDEQMAYTDSGLPMFYRDQCLDIARAIEAKLKEKNT